MKREDLTGNRYVRLTAVSFSDRINGRNHWLFACDCGNQRILSENSVKRGLTKSCGCLRAEKAKQNGSLSSGPVPTHGKSKIPEYFVWKSMRQRCGNPKSTDYTEYGGRGITVCERWSDFQNFIKDMGNRPSAKHSIDRIDNSGNYEPANCRWVTNEIQATNRRKRRPNK